MLLIASDRPTVDKVPESCLTDCSLLEYCSSLSTELQTTCFDLRQLSMPIIEECMFPIGCIDIFTSRQWPP